MLTKQLKVVTSFTVSVNPPGADISFLPPTCNAMWYLWMSCFLLPSVQEHHTIQNPLHMVGGFWGGEMTSIVYTGHLVTKIEGWGAEGVGITGLRVTFSNGKVIYVSFGACRSRSVIMLVCCDV